MKQKYKNSNLFRLTVKKLQEKGKMPDILDYCLAESYSITEFSHYAWDTIGYLRFGSNEGIYLDMYAIGGVTSADKEEKIHLGTCKTLRSDREAMQVMAVLQADFIWEMNEFVSQNLDDFTWIGYDVTIYRKGNKYRECTCLKRSTKDRLLVREMLEDDYAIIRDNSTRKTVKITIKDLADKEKSEVPETLDKTYKVPCVWQMMGYMRVPASSPEESLKKAQLMIDDPATPLPDDGEYLDETLQIDEEGEPIEVV